MNLKKTQRITSSKNISPADKRYECWRVRRNRSL